ncbi:MAG: hypothetical protein GVY13_15515 [Alphaproteobacteria bacterium]|jgi:hypothetical protein|nr:hypothetical protein [Alphaproteobacteria bacterium]
MAASLHPDIHDRGLVELRDTADRVVAVSGTPADYAAVAGTVLAEAAIAPADFTLGPGDVSGRRIACAGKTAFALADGTVASLCLLDDDQGGRLLLRVDDTTTGAVTLGAPVAMGEISYESRDPG